MNLIRQAYRLIPRDDGEDIPAKKKNWVQSLIHESCSEGILDATTSEAATTPGAIVRKIPEYTFDKPVNVKESIKVQ